MIGLEHYLTVAAALFVIGIFGIFLNRKNVIILLMSIELILLAVNINLVAFSSFLGDLVGQIFTLFVLTVAAAEAICRDHQCRQTEQRQKRSKHAHALAHHSPPDCASSAFGKLLIGPAPASHP